MEEKYPGLAEESLLCPPKGSLSCTLPEVDATGSTQDNKRNKIKKTKMRKKNKNEEPTEILFLRTGTNGKSANKTKNQVARNPHTKQSQQFTVRVA